MASTTGRPTLRRQSKALLTAVAGILVTAASACSTQTAAPEPPSTADAPPPPAIVTPEVTTITAIPEAAANLREGGSQASEEWYIGTLKAADVTSSRQTLLDLRVDVCSMLDSGTSAANLLRGMATLGYSDPEQQGVILAASMTSYCPESSLTIPVQALDGVSVETDVETG